MSYTHCEKCGKVIWWDAVEYEDIDGEILCLDCFAYCEECQEPYKINENGDELCEKCKEPPCE
jgi:hypothetical protein